VPVKGSEFEIALDTLVVAISEQPEAETFQGLRTTKWNTVETNPESTAAGKPGVFSGGDVARGPTGVIEAIADGKRAALMIDRYLTGRQMKLIKKVRLPSIYIEPLMVDEDDRRIRIHPGSRYGRDGARVQAAHELRRSRDGSVAAGGDG
jgi:hypothetical protein